MVSTARIWQPNRTSPTTSNHWCYATSIPPLSGCFLSTALGFIISAKQAALAFLSHIAPSMTQSLSHALSLSSPSESSSSPSAPQPSVCPSTQPPPATSNVTSSQSQTSSSASNSLT